MPKTKQTTGSKALKKQIKKHRQKIRKELKTIINAVITRQRNSVGRTIQMKSFSNPGKTYIVSNKLCTCPDFKYRRRARGESCKHMRYLQTSKE